MKTERERKNESGINAYEEHSTLFWRFFLSFFFLHPLLMYLSIDVNKKIQKKYHAFGKRKMK